MREYGVLSIEYRATSSRGTAGMVNGCEAKVHGVDELNRWMVDSGEARRPVRASESIQLINYPTIQPGLGWRVAGLVGAFPA